MLFLLPSLSLGLPLDGTLTAMCERGTGNHTIAIVLQSGSERIAAVFEGHRLATEPPTSQLSVSLKHNISKIKQHGIPFVLEAAGYYEVRRVLPVYNNSMLFLCTVFIYFRSCSVF